ncbi:MAG: hypothetical protein KGV46_02920 [Pasteurella sp.]|nr:hypothetical protein [Pasteurella sp.]
MAYEQMDKAVIAELANEFDKQIRPQKKEILGRFLSALFSDTCSLDEKQCTVFKNKEDYAEAMFAMSGNPYHSGITGISELHDN